MDDATQTQRSEPAETSLTEDSDSLLVKVVGIQNSQETYRLDKSGSPQGLVWKFGRGVKADCQMDVSKRRISGIHFKIWATNDNPPAIMLTDVSTNGTWLNSVKLTKDRNYVLVNGDTISVGNGVASDETVFVVIIPSMARNQSSLNNAEQGVHKDYEFQEVLGQGAFALVRKAIDRRTGERRAVKIINKNQITQNVAVNREIEILKQVKHKYIVCLHDFYEDKNHYYLVMDYVPYGDLMDFVQLNSSIPEDASREIVRQILVAVNYVHGMGISHRDLKPDNVLINTQDPVTIKVADFGLAKFATQQSFLTTFCGTLSYLAPEVLASDRRSHVGSRYSNLVDIWSIGCLAYVILTGYMPFNGSTQEELYHTVKTGKYNLEPLQSRNISQEGLDFLSKVFAVDPAERPTAEEALKLPWLVDLYDSNDELEPVPAPSQAPASVQEPVVPGAGKVDKPAHGEIEQKRQPSLPAVPPSEDLKHLGLDELQLQSSMIEPLASRENSMARHVPSLIHDSDSDSSDIRANAEEMASQKRMASNVHASIGIRDIDDLDSEEYPAYPLHSWMKLVTAPQSKPFKDIFLSSDSIRIGRVWNGEPTDIVANFKSISQLQCRIFRKYGDNGLWKVYLDVYGGNPCYVNAAAVSTGKRTQLFEHDQVAIFASDDEGVLLFSVHFLETSNFTRTRSNKDVTLRNIPAEEMPAKRESSVVPVEPTRAKRPLSKSLSVNGRKRR